MMMLLMLMLMLIILMLISQSNEQGTDKFALVCVGHSLGGGTAAILAIILRCQKG